MEIQTLAWVTWMMLNLTLEVSAANARILLKKKRKFDSAALENIATEDAVGNSWKSGASAGVKKLASLAEELSTLLSDVEGIQDRTSQFNFVNQFLIAQKLPHIPACPFHQWMLGNTKNPQFLQDSEVSDGINLLKLSMIQKRDVKSAVDAEYEDKQRAVNMVSNLLSKRPVRFIQRNGVSCRILSVLPSPVENGRRFRHLLTVSSMIHRWQTNFALNLQF
jgi:hypothetical protein